MTKPVIVTRAAKGSPLTRTELDNNFSNIDNATIGISDGTNSGTLDLNDQLTFAASGSATVAYDSSTKTVTVGASGGGNNIIVFGSGSYYRLRVNGTSLPQTYDDFVLYSNGGVSGVSAGGPYFTLPAGTYLFDMPFVQLTPANTSLGIYNHTTSAYINDNVRSNKIVFGAMSLTFNNYTSYVSFPSMATFTLSASSTLSFGKSASPNNVEIATLDGNMSGNVITFKFIKIA